MTIHRSDTLILPLLRLAGSRKFRNSDATEHLAAEFQLSPQERAELSPRGHRNKFANLVHWASGQLGMAELLKNQDGAYEITQRGRSVLASPPAMINRKFLAEFPEYKRRMAGKAVVQTENGEIEVEVPEREETPVPAQAEGEQELRQSIKMQASVAQLGALLGFNIWIPPTDRSRVSSLLTSESQKRLTNALPLNFDTATITTIENIDVIWLERRSVAHAFEIEHTTAIYSGLLRMADLLALQPRIQISLHIVAPASRREQVRREIVRPVFSFLEGGAMAERCSFISYDALDSILRQQNLQHTRETILAEYEEFFDSL